MRVWSFWREEENHVQIGGWEAIRAVSRLAVCCYLSGRWSGTFWLILGGNLSIKLEDELDVRFDKWSLHSFMRKRNRKVIANVWRNFTNKVIWKSSHPGINMSAWKASLLNFYWNLSQFYVFCTIFHFSYLAFNDATAVMDCITAVCNKN